MRNACAGTARRTGTSEDPCQRPRAGPAILPVWEDDRGLYRPLARTCGAAAVACLGVGAARPTPLVLGLALVVLLSIPWGLAVARRLASGADSPGTPQA
jgi:hypothetical protein